MFSSVIYKESPMPVRTLLVNSRALARRLMREGQGRRHDKDVLARQERLDSSTLLHLQWRMLHGSIRHAACNVPFYRRWFADHDVDVEHLHGPEDMERIPILEKSDVVAAGDSIKAVNVQRPHFSGSTSGTTGSPLNVWQDLEAIVRENAFQWRQRRWAGYRAGERRAWLRGDLIVPVAESEPPFWITSFVDRMLMMSSYHLSEANADGYIKALERFDPALIEAYPSSIGFLARYLEGMGREYGGSSLKGVVTSSETLTLSDRLRIERRFGTRVFDYYGSFERVVSIGTCEYGRYHLNSDYGYLETGPGNEVIGTGFNNRLMPLVRYRLNDSVTLEDPGVGCPCGRTLPVVRDVEGRRDDVVMTPDGRRIGRLDHIFKGLKGIGAAQILQESDGRIRIRVEPLKSFDGAMERMLLRNASDRLAGMEISIERVERLERTRNGKIRPVVSLLS